MSVCRAAATAIAASESNAQYFVHTLCVTTFDFRPEEEPEALEAAAAASSFAAADTAALAASRNSFPPG